MCCFRKIWPSVLWHFTQSSGTSVLSRSSALAEPCGSWQVAAALLHRPVLELGLGGLLQDGLVAAGAELVARLEQVELRRRGVRVVAAGAALLRRRACGCTSPSFGTTSSWQARQIWLGLASRSLPCWAACGLWQPMQSFDFTGVCTKGFFSTSAKVAWHSRQVRRGARLQLELLLLGRRLGLRRPGDGEEGGHEQGEVVVLMVGSPHFPGACGRRRRSAREGRVLHRLEELGVLRGVGAVAARCSSGSSGRCRGGPCENLASFTSWHWAHSSPTGWVPSARLAE